MKKNISTKGYMLIELLVVISVILVLATFIISNLAAARQKAQNVKILSEIRSVQSGLALYFSDYGGYPFPNDFNVHCVSPGCKYLGVTPAGPALVTEYLSEYMNGEAGKTPPISIVLGGETFDFEGVAYKCIEPVDAAGLCQTALLLYPTFGTVSSGVGDGLNTLSSQFAGEANEEIPDDIEIGS